MKPTVESYRAAAKVNALSPEIDVFEKADSVQELEGSTFHSVMASCELLFRDLRQGHGTEWIASEPGRAFVLLAQQAHFGYVRRKQPVSFPGRYPTGSGAKNKGIGEVGVNKSKRQGIVDGTQGSRTCS